MLHNQAPFLIYNASAGSGKTFTLVKAYLTKLISSNKPDFFKHILAITFTNKAVGEMKERILENLFSFSEETILQNETILFTQVCQETNLEPKEVHRRAKSALNYVLHNYSAFDVETIDRFNHRLIRTFARDLKLAANFEVYLDVNILINEAIDNLLSKVGVDKNLTSFILEFSFEKMAEDKSWDITSDLKMIGKLLYAENEMPHTEHLKNKTFEDFKTLKIVLSKKLLEIKKALLQFAQEFFDLMATHSLTETDFTGKSLPNFFNKIKVENYKVLSDAKWQETLGETALYPKRVTDDVKTLLDRLSPEIVAIFNETKKTIHQFVFIETLSKNVNALALLNAIQTEYIRLQEEKNILPISEFNVRINKEIKEQPAPFIYERLGEKYKHFFIDEFQDTSQMQWQNLTPLIDNALSQTIEADRPGSLLLVGDAKQSIYRWRGGEPEQFISLYDHFNPFLAVKKKVETLETNYRSYDEIITFNNSFFSFISNSLSEEKHSNLYLIGNNQEVNKNIGGYVSLSFVEATNNEEAFLQYSERVLEIIKDVLTKGYAQKDICILVRKNKQAIALAEHLSNNDVDVVSADALLLNNAPEIKCIINLLTLTENFEDKKARVEVLYFLYSHLKIKKEEHTFVSEMLEKTKESLTRFLKTEEIDFDFEAPAELSLYEFCETICRNFSLSKARISYIQSFLELVFEYSQSENDSVAGFLDYWETKKTKSSIAISDELNSVKILTVHKAKGLEFPVVIYPFADDDMYDFKKDHIWFPLNEQEFSGFSEMLIPVKNTMENFNETGKKLFEAHKAKSELDAFNIIYVAMTRAVEQLYVISNQNNIKKEKHTSSLFYNYLKSINKWEDAKHHYEFGKPIKPSYSEITSTTKKQLTSENFADTKNKPTPIKIATHSPLLWNSDKESPQEKGDLLHKLLAKIVSKSDIDASLDKSYNEGILSSEQIHFVKTIIEKIVANNQIKKYFEEGVHAKNEIEIFTQNGEILRPDRINFTENNKVTIIDYKTGEKNIQHHHQIINYGEVLNQMGFEIKELLLVYIKQEIEVVNVPIAS